MKERFLAYLRSAIELPAEEEKRVSAILKSASLAKGAYFIREGQVPRRFAFVGSGLFRYLYMDPSGREYTKNFIPEGQFLSAYSAMISSSPSHMFIEALEDSEILEIDYGLWMRLQKGHPCWNTLLVQVLERAFSTKEKRERELLLLNAEDRYRIFREEFPGLESRVRQHIIASYLGISPVSLSRIRKSRLR
ncbi:MAG: Crp/Fnr family transcriptional regulator [Flavobacteriales bacterium]